MSFWQVTLKLLEGFAQNCNLFFLTLVLSLPLGLIITFGSMSKFTPLRWLTRTFVWVIRGTPLMLQLFVVLYVPGLVFNMPFRSRMTAAVIAFVINYAAYFSEIFRGGIASIPKGQYEAGQVLGMTNIPSGAGMGTSGLVGQFGAFAAMGETMEPWLFWLEVILMHFVLPAVLTLAFDAVFRKLGCVKHGDMKLSTK